MDANLYRNLSRIGTLLVALAGLCLGCASSGISSTSPALPPASATLPQASPNPTKSTATALATTDTATAVGPTATVVQPAETAAVPPATVVSTAATPTSTATKQPATATLTTAPPTATAVPSPAAFDWPQFNLDPQHSGNNTQESTITLANVAELKQLFRVSLPAIADGAPAFLSGVSTAGGTRDLLFLTTKAGHIVAVDAHTGEQIWVKQYPAGSCRINNGSQPCYTTSSPAIDPSREYVYSYGLDGKVHKYQVGDGKEITTGGWPEVTTLKPFNEKGSSALAMATASDGNTYLYMTNGGYLGDRGDYQGHVTAINLADGSQRVFNTDCSNQAVHFVEKPGTPDCPAVQSAIWARAGVVYYAATDRIYMATGNGDYDPARHDWGDSVIALHPDGTGYGGDPVDSYTPTDYQRLQDLDLDLGSTAPAILPVPAGSSVAHLGLQGGKDAVLRLLDLDNLSGQGGPGHTGGEVAVLNGIALGDIFTAPAVWVDPNGETTWAFLVDPRAIHGLRLVLDSSGKPSLEEAWTLNGGGSSPIIANGVVYYASYSGIRALDPTSGRVLWHDASIGNIHWESPIVANGILYITDESRQLTAYSH
jgi:outer membrane protein assembly factor BamB